MMISWSWDLMEVFSDDENLCFDGNPAAPNTETETVLGVIFAGSKDFLRVYLEH